MQLIIALLILALATPVYAGYAGKDAARLRDAVQGLPTPTSPPALNPALPTKRDVNVPMGAEVFCKDRVTGKNIKTVGSCPGS